MGDTEILCNNCKRDIPAANADLHLTHCLKFMKLCELCNDPYPIREFDQHLLEDHQEVECGRCKQVFQQGDEDVHKRHCIMVPVKCEYCQTECPKKDISHHLERCGTRTDNCDFCDERVMLKDMKTHVCQTRTQDTSATIHPGHTYTQNTSDISKPRNNQFIDELRSYQPPSTNIGAEYLDELISTTHFDPINGSTVDLDAALAAQLAHDDHRSAEKKSDYTSESVFPCEFCDAVLSMEDLMIHQTACYESYHASSTNQQQHQQPTFMNEFGEEEEYIPCEYCCKQFPFHLIGQHQSGCTPTRKVPSYTDMLTEDRPNPEITQRGRGVGGQTRERKYKPPFRSKPPARRENHQPAPIPLINKPQSTRSDTQKKQSARPGANPKPSQHSPATSSIEKKLSDISIRATKLEREVIPKPTYTARSKGKERARNAAGKTNRNMNDLDRTSTSKEVPAVVVPKRKTNASHLKCKSQSSSDNNSPDDPHMWPKPAPKTLNMNPMLSGIAIGKEPKATNGGLHDANDFAGTSKETNKGKNVSTNIPTTADNLKTRQNILNKYQKSGRVSKKTLE